MSFLQKGLLQIRTPFTEFRRFRGKINIRRPRRPHFMLQKFIDITQPIYQTKKDVPEYEKCANIKDAFTRKVIDNPLQHILAKECANWFNHSKMIAFFHLNSIIAEDLGIFRKSLKKENMHLRQYGKAIVEEAISNTPYEAVFTLFNSHTYMVFSEDIKPAKMLSIAKKTPQLIFLAGVIDGKFLSKNTFVEYSKFPSLEVMQSQLCNILLSSGLQLTNQLTQHQTALVNNLDAYVKMKQSEENKDKSD